LSNFQFGEKLCESGLIARTMSPRCYTILMQLFYAFA